MKRLIIINIVVTISLLVFNQASAQSQELTIFSTHIPPSNPATMCFTDYNGNTSGLGLEVWEDATITSIGFYNPATDTNPHIVAVWSYTHYDGGLAGDLLYQQSTSAFSEGWHWIRLDSPVYLVGGSPNHYIVTRYSYPEVTCDADGEYDLMTASDDLWAINAPLNIRGATYNAPFNNNLDTPEMTYPYLNFNSWTTYYYIDITFLPGHVEPDQGEDDETTTIINFSAVLSIASDFLNNIWPIIAVVLGIQFGGVILIFVWRAIRRSLIQ